MISFSKNIKMSRLYWFCWNKKNVSPKLVTSVAFYYTTSHWNAQNNNGIQYLRISKLYLSSKVNFSCTYFKIPQLFFQCQIGNIHEKLCDVRICISFAKFLRLYYIFYFVFLHFLAFFSVFYICVCAVYGKILNVWNFLTI